MKISIVALLMAVASSNAFVAPDTRSSVGTFSRGHRGIFRMTASGDEVDKLRAAAAKAREEAAKLSKVRSI